MRQSEEGAFAEFAEARLGPLFRSACLLIGGDTRAPGSAGVRLGG
ncbi:hypothetical protein [Streptomyces halstedii]